MSQLRTLHSTLQEFQQSLPIAQVPPTFWDAIEVLHQLGFCYLWIDSLCVIQDDENNWRLESQNMDSIFEESSCTIAAIDVLDDDGNDDGLLLPRDGDPLAVRLALPYDKISLAVLSRRAFRRESAVRVWKFRWLASPTADSNENTVIIRPRTVSLYNNSSKAYEALLRVFCTSSL
jgi:hypothetical protein